MFSTTLKYFFQTFEILLSLAGEDSHVVKIDCDTSIKKVPES